MSTVNRPEDNNSDFDDNSDINDLPVDLPPCPPLHAATSAIVVDEQRDPKPLDVPLVTGPVCYHVLKKGDQNWIVVINQRLKKRFFLHHVPPARATDKKSNQDWKQERIEKLNHAT